MIGVFLTTSPMRVVAGVLCLVTSPVQVHVGEPVVPCLIVALLLRAVAYDCMALAPSAGLFMVDIELCVKLGKEVFRVWGCGFSGMKFREKGCSVMHIDKVED